MFGKTRIWIVCTQKWLPVALPEYELRVIIAGYYFLSLTVLSSLHSEGYLFFRYKTLNRMDGEKKPKVIEWINEKFVFFGPGLLLAITAAGQAGISYALDIGAHFQLTLLWIVILTLLFKYAFATGIARYTLATGKTIFEGFGSLPGPKNWGFLLTIASYLLVVVSLGATVLFAATFLDYLIPGTYYIPLVGIFILLLVLLILRTRVYHHFEIIVAVLIVLLSIFAVILLSYYIRSPEYFLNGLTFNIPKGSEASALAIIGVVGSGLDIMLYSVWLEKKIQKKKQEGINPEQIGNKSFFKRYIKSVRLDIIIGFVIVAVITVGFMALGNYAYLWSYMPTEGVNYSIDLLISQVSAIFNEYPFGVYIFVILVALIFFGAVAIGLDAQTTAVVKTIAKMRESSGKKITNPSPLYTICLGIFALFILGAILINEPLVTSDVTAVICAILFGIFGFILLYLDSRLPKYARGNRFWILLITVGSVLSIFVALLLQGSVLDLGFPLFKEMAVCVVVILIFTRTKLFKRIMAGTANLADKFWIAVIFGALSIYGAIFGVVVPGLDGISITFRDLGPIISGLLGGPVVGLITGLIGGIFHLSMGGVTALPGFIGTAAVGLIAGIAVRIWKGKITWKRMIYLGVVVEFIHLLIVSIYELITQQIPVDVGDFLIQSIQNYVPMALVIVVGLLFFFYFIRNTPVIKEAEKPMGLAHLRDEIKDLFKNEDDDT